MTRPVRVFSTKNALCVAAAEEFVTLAAQAVRDHGQFTVALSGGATPNGMYGLLATKKFRSRVSWRDVHVFWGDERCVAPDDPRSNYRAAFELLLAHVPVPAANVHRIRGECDPADAADEYERALRVHFSTPIGAPRFTARARFDLVLLGLGTDGHTASLFPGADALEESRRWVVAEYATSALLWRVTATFPLLNAAANVRFLVSGREKRDIMARILSSHDEQNALPAQRVHLAHGELQFLLDTAAMPSSAMN